MDKNILKCENCGASLEVDESSRIAVCPYCKGKVIYREENGQEKAESYKLLKEAQTKADNKAAFSKKMSEIKIKFVSAFIVIAVFTVVGVLALSIRKEVKDPFEFVDVKFNGLDGSINADIVYLDIDKEISYEIENIDYKLSEYSSLSEGQTITLTATSSMYKLKTKKKKFKVTGTSIYVNNLEKIDSNVLKQLNNEALVAIKTNFKENKYVNLQNISYKKLVLFSDNGRNSVITLVYLSKVKTAKKGTIINVYSTYSFYNVSKNLESLQLTYEKNYSIDPYYSCEDTFMCSFYGFKNMNEVKNKIKKIFNKEETSMILYEK